MGLGLVASVGVLVVTHHRHRTVHRALVGTDTDRVPLPSGVLPLAVIILAVGGRVAADTLIVVNALVRQPIAR